MSDFETQERRFVVTVFLKNEYFHIVVGSRSIQHPDAVLEHARQYAERAGYPPDIDWKACDCCPLSKVYWPRYEKPQTWI
jgi:hypothetical protein